MDVSATILNGFIDINTVEISEGISIDTLVSENSAVFNINQPQLVMIPQNMFGQCYVKPYFNHFNGPCYDNEKKIMGHIAAEMWNQHGVKMEYYKTDYNTDYDKIWGEDRDRHILRTFPLQGYFLLPAEDELVTIFGMEIKDVFKIYVAKQHFSVASTLSNTGCGLNTYPPFEPCVGDIIKGRWSNYFYEIIEVKDSEGVILESKLVWTLIVRIYRDLHMTANTFVPPIKHVQEKQESIEEVTDRMGDIFQINEDINEEKIDILYNTSAVLEDPINPDRHPPTNDDPFGSW